MLFDESEADEGDGNEYDHQAYRDLHQRFFHTSPGAIYRIRLPEYPSETTALDLRQNRRNQGNGQYYLRYRDVCIHQLSPDTSALRENQMY
jgi:hypothetical protein